MQGTVVVYVLLVSFTPTAILPNRSMGPKISQPAVPRLSVRLMKSGALVMDDGTLVADVAILPV